MGYIESNLMSGEYIVHRSTLHWIIFSRPIFFILVAVLMLSNETTILFGGLVFLIGLVDGVGRFVSYRASEFGVTNKRVLVKVGIIQRRSVETLLSKVEGIGVDQTIWGRMLGYGTIVVTGTGGTAKPFEQIREPLEFRRKVQEQISGSG